MKKYFLLLLFANKLVVAAPPQLIVQIVVDQLRGDLIHQYQADFTDKGFNYLLKHSYDYSNTHHSHALTVTCVGHATIATGSYPALHGIIGNKWFDRATHTINHCTDDSSSPLLPTSRTKQITSGQSPHLLVASTLSDELVLSQKGRAFAVSLKNRAAIMLAGHAGKAFWFDKTNGGFITSQYYYQSYPQWVNDWNTHYQPQLETWQLSYPLNRYHNKEAATFSNRFLEFNRNFPHSTGESTNSIYYKLLSMTPKADELTANFAETLLKQEQLGKIAGKTDYLGISFSAVDGVGHQFGPNSLESEDNLLRLDKTIAHLLQVIDEQVGLDNTLIVLTADHGVTDSAIYLQQHHIPTTQSLTTKQLTRLIHEELTLLDLPTTILQAISLPYVYLNHDEIAKHHLKFSSIINPIIEKLNAQENIFQVYTMPTLAEDWLGAKVSRMSYTKRSGDLFIITYPFQLGGNPQRIDHSMPWNYNSYVPLLIANAHFKEKRISRAVSTTDIAPTLASILSIKPPSSSTGVPLSEVVESF